MASGDSRPSASPNSDFSETEKRLTISFNYSTKEFQLFAVFVQLGMHLDVPISVKTV